MRLTLAIAMPQNFSVGDVCRDLFSATPIIAYDALSVAKFSHQVIS